MKIDICICTFRRPFVVETLASVDAAQHPAGAELRLIVVDNDDTASARAAVEAKAVQLRLPVLYLHVPGANISIARNAALEAAQADWIAFLDDDEVVDPDWLAALLARQRETGADAVFGRSAARYDADAPDWMVRGDFHSQAVAPRDGVIQTGHTCNALLRWDGAPWQDARFEIARGRSGGEDTEFFFRLHRMGAVYAEAPDSVVREDVPASRLSLGWLLQRRYRIGQSYAASAESLPERARLLVAAGSKAAYCGLRALLALPDPERRAFWSMRGTMHAGVCAGCLKLPQPALYGEQG